VTLADDVGTFHKIGSMRATPEPARNADGVAEPFSWHSLGIPLAALKIASILPAAPVWWI